MIVIGVDAADWGIIKPNLDRLPNWKWFLEEGEYGTISLDFKPLSPISWTSMFSGIPPKEHGHRDFREGSYLKKREDIDINFIWDTLGKKGVDVKALNIPFVVPPYSYGCDFQPANMGFGKDIEEIREQTIKVSGKAIEIASGDYDLFIVVFAGLDRLQHFNWGKTDLLVKWYKKIGGILRDLIFLEQQKDDKFLIVSDHGFCDFEEAEFHTLKRGHNERLKGEHSTEAIYISKGVGEPEKITDVHDILLNEFDANPKEAGASPSEILKEKPATERSLKTIRVNIPRLIKVIENGGDCLCKKNISCPCQEARFLAEGKLEGKLDERCTCQVFYKKERKTKET